MGRAAASTGNALNQVDDTADVEMGHVPNFCVLGFKTAAGLRRRLKAAVEGVA